MTKNLKKSENFSDTQIKIVEEIVNYFKEEVSSQDWADYIEEECSIHSSLKKHQLTWCVGFMSPRSCCSGTSFWAPGISWESPDKNEYHKGVCLYDIQQEVGAQILTFVINKFHELGYRVGYRSDDPLFEDYAKKVTISW